jgi:hypothetical protein
MRLTERALGSGNDRGKLMQPHVGAMLGDEARDVVAPAPPAQFADDHTAGWRMFAVSAKLFPSPSLSAPRAAGRRHAGERREAMVGQPGGALGSAPAWDPLGRATPGRRRCHALWERNAAGSASMVPRQCSGNSVKRGRRSRPLFDARPGSAAPTIDLTEDKHAAISAAIQRLVEDDKFRASRLDPLRSALAKLDPPKAPSKARPQVQDDKRNPALAIVPRPKPTKPEIGL